MNYSAHDMFADWYNQGLKKEASNEELTSRRTVLDKILGSSDPTFWLNALGVFLGLVKADDPIYKQLASEFKEQDDFFSLTNENLLRLLIGCAIAEKIEENANYVSDLLALAIINTFPEEQEILPAIVPLAHRFWINECESSRSMEFSKNPEKIKSAIGKTPLPTMADHTGIPDFVKQLTTFIGVFNKDNISEITAINGILEWNSMTEKNFKSLSEETNILWWIFGEYSNIFQKSFHTFSPQLLSVVSALELDQLTVSLPGAGKIDAIINKVLSILDKTSSQNNTLEEIVSSIKEHQEAIKANLPTMNPILIPFCPYTFGLTSYLEYSEVEWKDVYFKKTKINCQSTTSLSRYASQLYRELMMIRVWKHLTSDK